MNDRWPGESSPAPPPSRLRAPGPAQVVGARDCADRWLTPPGSLGVLDRALDRVVALGHGRATGGVLVVGAADHPVARYAVSADDAALTRDLVAAAIVGTAIGATAARAAGLTVRVVDAGVSGDPLPGAVPLRPIGPGVASSPRQA